MKETIHFKVSEEDKKYLQEEANRLRIPVGSYVRMLALSKQKENV